MPVRKKKKNLAREQKMEKARHLKEFVKQFKDIIEKAAVLRHRCTGAHADRSFCISLMAASSNSILR
jgi:2,3-bisphosphoglycerate-independent phosphoglycerate mutase